MTSSRSKFDAFEKKDIVYTTVAQHQIQASVFTPRPAADDISPKRPPTTAPVLVYWHGGGFIVGDRLYEPWWPVWLLEFALAKGAMIIAPDYRLLPEATGADIMDDMHAFWNWFLHSLPGIAASECWDHWPDVHRVISAGHSAGGSLALHSAMQRLDVPVRAVLSLYGPLYYDVPELRTARPRPILGVMPPPPRQAERIIRTYVQRTKGTVRTAGDVLEMWGLVACILQQGRLPRMMMARHDPRLDALAVIERRKWCPPIWVVHAESDSVVPASCSIEFVRRVEQTVPGVQKRLSVLPGEHNFDASLTMEEPWIADGCTFLENHWNE